MNFPDKAKVGVDAKVYHHKCEHFHETTSDFYIPNIPFIKKIKGKTNIKDMVVEYYSRCNPMPIPTMGIAYTKLNWYFVPFRILWKGYEAWKTKTVFYYNNQANYISSKPWFYLEDYMNIIINESNGFCREVTDPTAAYDFQYTSGLTPANKKYRFTKFGIQWYTIMCQLGYNVGNLPNKAVKCNALPLLAFCKVIADCYTPKAFADYEQNYLKLYAILNAPLTQKLDSGQLSWLFNWFTVVCYEDDYFNSAWLNPTGPNNETNGMAQPSLAIPTTDANGNIVMETIDSTGNMAGWTLTIEENAKLSNQVIAGIKALDRYMKTNQIVGTKYWDKLLALYGIETDKALLNVPELIASDKIYYRFNEVMCNSDNTSTSLGDYAGSGETTSDGNSNLQHFNYYAEEEGYLICIATNECEIAYGHGFDKDIFDLETFDDYTDKFDGMMTEPIHALEVYSGYDAPTNDWLTSNIWGFTTKYGRQKITLSKCTGLMNMNSYKNEMAKWNFLRWYNFNDFPYRAGSQNAKKIQNSVYNCLGYGADDNNETGCQYTRIFYGSETPNFNMYFRFSFDMINSMKPYWFEDNLADDDDKMITVDAV